MKTKAESLGVGFYLSFFILLIVGGLWVLLAPRKIDPDDLTRILQKPAPAETAKELKTPLPSSPSAR